MPNNNHSLRKDKMIKHIVLFKLADVAEGRTKLENASILKEQLENLQNLIPAIRKIKVSINHAAADQDNYDIILDSEFDSFEDLNEYANHPEHLRVGDYVKKVRTSRSAIDYEL